MSGRRTIVWSSEARAGLLRAVARQASLEIVGAGSESRGQGALVAAALETEPLSDLRTVLSGADADLLLLADPGDFGASGEDAELVLTAARRGMRVVAMEPMPSGLIDLRAAGWDRGIGDARPVDAVLFCPLLRLARSVREALDVLEAFGSVRMGAIEGWASPAELSLGAMLVSAVDVAMVVLGEIQSVQAVYRAPDSRAGVPERLRGLIGDLGAILRGTEGRACTLTLSTSGARWNRSITLVGQKGRLRVFDDGFEWIGSDGGKVEESRRRTRGEGPAVPLAVEAIAEQVSAVLEPAGAPVRYDAQRALAAAEAVLLAARTGQAESPATIARAAGIA